MSVQAEPHVDDAGSNPIRKLKTTATEICIRDYRSIIEALKPLEDEAFDVGINSTYDPYRTPCTCVTTQQLSKGHRIKLSLFASEERLEDETNTDGAFSLELIDCERNQMHQQEFDTMKDAMQVFHTLFLFFI
jgi:hypothetical protein